MDLEIEVQLAPLRAKVKEQGDIIREMKAASAAVIDVKKEVLKLKALRKELEDLTLKLDPPEKFDRNKMADLAKRRFFYDNSFAIYGGITGQYDFGHLGSELVNNLLDVWRKHFVIPEGMQTVTCSILTPEPVLKASGHMEKFADFMVKDTLTGECHRLDHLIKLHLEKKISEKSTSAESKKEITTILTRLDGMDVNELGALLKQFDMKSPTTGNPLTEPEDFNLMFPISIGPSGEVRGFLRPETAQGIFVNFKRLLEFNQSRLPFAVAQIGNAYRNEISPRSGLLRVREFMMAEIEHFCYPDDKDHPNFDSVSDEVMTLYSACGQMSGESAKNISIGEAVRGFALKSLGLLETPTDLQSLDDLLSQQSYVSGYQQSQADRVVFKTLCYNFNIENDKMQSFEDIHGRLISKSTIVKGTVQIMYMNVVRWLRHIQSYTPDERIKWKGSRGENINDWTDGKNNNNKGLVANETLGYYMARIQMFLLKIGIKPKKLRFRQHMANEMAHYACDCWDAECLTSYGWIECVGCADRSAYDLSCHAKATGVKLTVERDLPEPKTVETVIPVLDKGLIGKTFKKQAKELQEKLAALSIDDIESLDKNLTVDGKATVPGTAFELTRAMVPSVKKESKKVHVEELAPSVVEPSFGIGRVFYALLEQTFTVRENDDQKTYFALPVVVTPIKVSVLPLSNKPEFVPFTKQISSELRAANVSVRIDNSTGSIGRRYARTDEISIPFAVTVDFDSITKTPATVTLRERDTTEQVRIPVSCVSSTVSDLTSGRMCWGDVMSKYPKFTQQENTE